MVWLVELNDLGGIDVGQSAYIPTHPGTVFEDDQEREAWLHAIDCIEDRMESLRSSMKTARRNLRRLNRREQARAIAERTRSTHDR
ncbi:hypothetical protein EGM87_22620 [Sphingobium sp. RSMS]|uniref:hypothetical protein n=1 Tax=Sphingobium sp. RSMS TaxID=520734 RepID=UPI0010F4C0E5|nr:hypothetical protein [Sphingobium sp. RSMS]UXC93093.1 hypothetical protein EGM87_22620 [Sphingobium sp. RSMS]